MFYMNEIRKNSESIKLVGGEPKAEVRRRLGKPESFTETLDTFRLRGRLDKADFSRQASAMSAFTFGLGEIVLFPYVLVDETAGAVADHFCVDVIYDTNDRALSHRVYDCK